MEPTEGGRKSRVEMRESGEGVLGAVVPLDEEFRGETTPSNERKEPEGGDKTGSLRTMSRRRPGAGLHGAVDGSKLWLAWASSMR